MTNNQKILREGQRTQSGGIIHKGTNYVNTPDGLMPAASNDTKMLKQMEGVDLVPTDGGHKDFNLGFGAYGIGHKQVYTDPMGFQMGWKVDARPDIKALDSQTGGEGTAGYALVPVYVDPRVVDVTRKFTPLVEMIPRVANLGTTADYNNLTAKGSAAWKQEDASMADQNDTFNRLSTPIKYGYAVGRVTGVMQAAMPSYTLPGFAPSGSGLGGGATIGGGAAPNAKQLEVLVKTRSLRELQESTIVNGNAGTNALEYTGIVSLMSSTNTVDKNTSALDLADINTAVKNAFDDGGRPNLAVCSSGVYTDLVNLMTDQFRYPPTTKLPWGFETLSLRTMVGEIPVIPSMYLSNTSGSKAMYFLDMSVVEMRVLQDVMYQDLARTSDSEKFLLKVYEALIIKNTAFCSSITEISA